jgi:hypothetical protein
METALSLASRFLPKGHKRKRSIQDTSVDLSKMKMAISHAISLKEELAGIQETEAEMEAVMEHVHALQKILESAKKPKKQVCKLFSPSAISMERINFSSLSKKDLSNLGISKKKLIFNTESINELLSLPRGPSIAPEFTSLNARLDEIYDHVNMDVRVGRPYNESHR